MNAQHYVAIIFGGVGVIALLVALLIIRALVRASFLRSPRGQDGPTFALSKLQEMLQQGQISYQEFEKMKRNLTAQITGKSNLGPEG